ncbi:MAG: hypothetical protein ACYDEH_05770 [Acidimicrobiales bacterium]
MSSRVVAAAVVGYIGAAPIPDAAIRDVVPLIAVAATLVWPRLMGRRSSCAVAPVTPSEPHAERARSSQLTTVERTEEHHVK